MPQPALIQNPIVILGAPRSGTSILERCLSLHSELWHLSSESHRILEGPFHPARNGFQSNRVEKHEVTDDIRGELLAAFSRQAINLNRVVGDPGTIMAANSVSGRIGSRIAKELIGTLSRIRKPHRIRFLEKTPKNTLRVPMLEVLFPDAMYVWNRRAPSPNIDSLIAGWKAKDSGIPLLPPRFSRSGYPIAGQLDLQDYLGMWWKFALVPGWRSLRGRRVGDVAALQYFKCNQFLYEDLQRIPQERIFSIRHEEFVARPMDILEELLRWAGLEWESSVENFAELLPKVNETTGHQRKGEGGLRFPEEVLRAKESLPDFDSLSDAIGYHKG